jgi:outer membrane protein assembly factor BamB
VTHHPKPRLHKVLVTVVDGDTHRAVRGVEVSVGRRVAKTGAHGVARIPLRRAALEVTVSKRGYLTRTIRVWFRRHPKSTLRIFQRRLQWPLYGATPQRTQAQTEIQVRPPFRRVWSRGTGNLIEFPAVVSEGVAYIGNAKGTIFALDMRNGQRIWTYDPPGGKMASSPAVVGRELVIHGMDGVVRVLDVPTGRLRWQLRVGSPVESSPIVRGGLDYFGAWNGHVYALDLKRRRLRWTRSFGCKITSSAAVAGPRLFIGDYCGRLLSLAPRTGRVQWSRHVNGRVYGTPAVARGRVFVPSSTGGSLTAFTTGGRYLWSRGTGSYVYSSPATWGGRVVFGSYNGLVYCLAARTGRTIWAVPAGGRVSGAAVVVDGVAYAGARRRITGVDVRTGKAVVRFPHGDYVPVSGGGKRLLLHGFSRLYAVEAR